MKFDKDEITYKEIDKMLRIGVIVKNNFEQMILNNALDTLGLLQFQVYELGMPVGEDLVMRVNFEDYDDSPELKTFRESSRVIKTFCSLPDFIDTYEKVLRKDRKKREPHGFNTTYQSLQSLQSTIGSAASNAAASIQQTAQSLNTVDFVDITYSSPFTLDDWVQQRHTGITQRR